MGFRGLGGLGFEVLGFKGFWGLGFRVLGLGFRDWLLGVAFGVWGLGLWQVLSRKIYVFEKIAPFGQQVHLQSYSRPSALSKRLKDFWSV